MFSRLAIKLFLSDLWNRIKALLDVALRHPWQAAVIAILCLSAWLWHGKASEHRRYLAERAGRAADRADYEQASAANLAAQIAQRRAWEAKSALTARTADNAFEQDRPLRRSLIADHADRMRADKVCSSAASAAAETATAEAGDGPGVLPRMVAVPRDEYEGLAENTRRLDEIRNVWAAGLLRDGLAVEVGD